MKKTATYFLLQLKRAARTFPFVLTISLLICLGLGLVLGTLVETDNAAEDKQKLSIGIVGDTSDEYLSLGIAAVKSFDSSRLSVNFLELSEAEAKAMLTGGELVAYIVIPDGFVEGIMYGDIKQITYVASSQSVGIAAMFKEEISAMVSRMVIESQKGVYGMQRLMRANGISGVSTQTDAMNLRYFSLIFNRTSVLTTEILGVSDDLSFAGYMTCGLLVLLLLLVGISCCPMFAKKETALLQLLAASGRRPYLPALCEYAVYLLVILVNLGVLMTAAMLTAGDALSLIPELARLSLADLPSLLVRTLPALLAITALQFLLYELSSDIVSGVLLQFLCAVSLGYISGCFYPIGFLPDTIRTLSQFTPSGAARQYLSALFTSRSATGDLTALLAFFILFTGLAAAVREYRTRRL